MWVMTRVQLGNERKIVNTIRTRIPHALLHVSVEFLLYPVLELGSIKTGELQMSNVKNDVQSLLETLPDDCTLEDIQYHLYVVEKVRRGIERAEAEGEMTQQEVEKRLDKWHTD